MAGIAQAGVWRAGRRGAGRCGAGRRGAGRRCVGSGAVGPEAHVAHLGWRRVADEGADEGGEVHVENANATPPKAICSELPNLT